MNTAAAAAGDRFGHPRGLGFLACAEAFERFSYYGMQSLLVLYMTHSLLMPDHIGHVVGFASVRATIESVTGPLSDAALISQIFGLYTGIVYLTPLLGGIVADRWLGRTATVTIGALLMAAGHFLMAFDSTFFLALALLLTGVGAFKGNIVTQVGELYARGDARRAGAYLILQIAIDISAIVSPLVCGTLGEKVGWHYGFSAAGIGMLVGLAVYLRGRPWLPASGLSVAVERKADVRMTARDWKTVALLVALVPLIAGSQVGNQQMFNAYVLWAERRLSLQWSGWNMPVTWLLSMDAFVAVVMTLATFAFWRAWSRRWREPDEIVKIAIGAAIMVLAPLVLALAGTFTPVGERISLLWAFVFLVVNEIGYAMVIPIGLALYSRAAPARMAGLMIGLFYLAFALANVGVGRLGGLLGRMDDTAFWLLHAGIIAVATLGLAAAARFGRDLLAPIDQRSG